jgi:hypothetical protein
LKDLVEDYSDSKFYNSTLVIYSNDQNFIFFDSKDNYASALQSYLELMQLDKREKEIAEDIKRRILSEFK